MEKHFHHHPNRKPTHDAFIRLEAIFKQKNFDPARKCNVKRNDFVDKSPMDRNFQLSY